MDLGCGRGKSLHVARSVLPWATLIGIDIHPDLIASAARNLGVGGAQCPQSDEGQPSYVCSQPKLKLLLSDVNDVQYSTLLAAFDVILVFNKNSFDRHTTKNTVDLIMGCSQGKKVFYIYNNPVFEDLFEGFPLVFQMSGWHKNWNTKVFQLSSLPPAVAAICIIVTLHGPVRPHWPDPRCPRAPAGNRLK